MAYIGLSDVTNILDSVNLAGMTNDYGSNGGAINMTVFNNICQMASDNADALVSSIYPVPFNNPPPQKIRNASLIFAAEMLYQRRLTPEDKNPMKHQADFWRETLKQINLGQLSLDESYNRGFSPIISKTYQSRVNSNIY